MKGSDGSLKSLPNGLSAGRIEKERGEAGVAGAPNLWLPPAANNTSGQLTISDPSASCLRKSVSPHFGWYLRCKGRAQCSTMLCYISLFSGY